MALDAAQILGYLCTQTPVKGMPNKNVAVFLFVLWRAQHARSNQVLREHFRGKAIRGLPGIEALSAALQARSVTLTRTLITLRGSNEMKTRCLRVRSERDGARLLIKRCWCKANTSEQC